MTRPSRAVIVAAGRSTRLYPLTRETPKCLLDVGGRSMLARSLELLRSHGITDVALVVGFEHEKVRAALAEDAVTCLYNPFFAGTNNLGSLWFAKPWVGDDAFVYLHADVVYAPDLLQAVLDDPPAGGATLLVDEGSVDAEAMKVRTDAHERLIESSKDVPLDEAAGEWIGVAAFSRELVPPLFETIEEVLSEGLLQAYDTEAFTRLASRGHPFEVRPTSGARWVEIDFPEDLERARSLFAP